MKQLFTLIMTLVWGLTINAQCVITGQVTDENGEALIGANVSIPNTNYGTSSNTNGIYTLDGLAPGKYTVEVTYVGFERAKRITSVVADSPKTIMHIQLERSAANLDELTVSATRVGDKDPFAYQNVTKEALEANNLGQDVPFLLKWTPSVVVTSDAGTGIGYTGIRIRGTDPTRINVTINGIPYNDSESQGTFWVNLPDFVSSTDDIQVTRGAGASTNGAGAFGGSINLNTSKVKEKAYGQIGLSSGSFGTQKANVQFGSGLLSGKFTLDGRLSHIESDGYIDRGSADLNAYYLSAAYLGEKSSLRFNVFSGHEVTYQAWNGVPESLLETNRTFNSGGTERAGEPHDNEVDDYTQNHLQLIYNTQINKNLSLNLAGHFTKGFGFFEQYKAGEDFSDYGLKELFVESVTFPEGTPSEVIEAYHQDLGASAIALQDEPNTYSYIINSTDLIRRRWLDNDFYGVVYGLNYITNDNKTQLTFGGAANQYLGRHFGEVIWARNASNTEQDHIYYDNDATKRDVNAYLKLNTELFRDFYAYGDIQFRQVNYAFTGFDDELNVLDDEVSLGFLNPKVGVLYQLDRGKKVYASFAVANKEPNRNDYTENPISVRPIHETLYDTEFGAEIASEKYMLGANAYYMSYKNQLVLSGQINDVGEYSRINVPESYRAGIELMGAYQLTKGFTANANATLSNNKVRAFTEYIDTYDADFNWLAQEPIERVDTDLAFSPNFIGSVGLKYDVFASKIKSKHGLTIDLSGKYVGLQYLDNSSDAAAVINPYGYVDLGLRYAFRPQRIKEIGVKLLVRNLTNNLYETNGYTYRYAVDGAVTADNWYYPQAGINYLLGLEVKF